MRSFWPLKILSFVFYFVLLAFGCVTGQSQQVKREIVVKTEAIDEGICVSFENIPPETTSLFIHFSTSDTVPAYSARDIVSTYSDIRGSALDQVKRTGKVVLPFVKTDRNYFISVSFEKDDEPLTEDDFWSECTPYFGINFAGDIELRLNESFTVATLYGEPVFPTAIRYASVKYDFRAFLDLYSAGSLSYSERDTVHGLAWDFEPLMTQYFNESGYLQRGDYPVFISVYCNVLYDNIPWTMEIVKSREFTFSLR